ncbi:predicted protein [Brucella suis bv. 5 str. 513]|nr:predicted protein [Brucella suis bv. 5 str. 513]
MIGLGECRSASVDGQPWQLSLLPTGYCSIRGETERLAVRKQDFSCSYDRLPS